MSGAAPAADLIGRAARALREGRLADVESLCIRAIESGVDVVQALDLRAAVALHRGDQAAAVDLLGQAVTRDPANPGMRYNLASLLHKMGRYDEAIGHYREVVTLDPNAVGVLFEMALALIDAKRGAEAVPHLRAVMIAAPHVPDAYFQSGTVDLESGRHREALDHYHRTLRCQPDYVKAHINSAVMYRELERVEESLRATSTALVLEPADGHLYNNLGMMLKEQGDDERNRRLFEHAVALVPGNADFQYSLAMVGRFVPGDHRLDGLEKLLAATPETDGGALTNLHFSLGKAYEDLGDFDRSFAHQEKGNRLRRASLSYDEERVLGGFGRIAAAFPADAVESRPGEGYPSEAPIFILGMPRSGSTLIEQILASHPRVFGAGELPTLATLVNEACDDMEKLTSDDYRAIGRRYVEQVRRRSPGHDRIVDKQTENFRLIGVIRRALPNARIIHSRRDPIDTCLSIYSKLFSSEMGFAYDLGEIGRYWRGYAGLMEHWRMVLPPGAMLEIDYETMVADQEGQTRRLLEYCGLEWHEGCLSFHQTRRAVRTASSQQVKRPMYKTSVGRWRPPAEALDRLKVGLGILS